MNLINGEIMKKRSQFFKCEVCGNIVQITHAGVGTLVCCNRSMRLLESNTTDEGAETHVPVIKVKVGSIQHPMEENHFIEWIEVQVGDEIYRKFLAPGMMPEAEFSIDPGLDDIIVYEYCTVHGLWRK